MRTPIILALLLLAGGVATAQSMIPISAYQSTYSYTRTRGYYFQCPIDFTVVGLRVPDEQKHGTQHVAVLRMPALPPAYPTTATVSALFYGTGPSANILPCRVSFKKGEWFGVLGACGDTSNLHNSYGAGPYQSNVLGAAVTLTRFITQTNIASNGGVSVPYSASTGSIGRVEVYVSSATLIGSGTGQPGSSINFTLTSAGDAGLTYQLGSSLGNGPIPIDTRSLGLSPDHLLALSVGGLLPFVFQNYVGVLDKQGAATAALNIPNFPALKGVRIYNAFLTLKATAPSGVSSISNTFLFTIQ